MNDIFNNPKEAWQSQPTSDWNYRLAAHLHRRAGFGGTRAEIAKSKKIGLRAAVKNALSVEKQSRFDKEMAPIERIFVNGQPRGLAAWWLLRMVKSPCPILEKMTLFWHGHFATSAAKVQNTRAMYKQNHLLRQHAMGKFAPMVQGISRDVAMLIYLDSTENRKTRPNENYARELMELFCLGPGNYTEADIKEVARCFTGWEVRKRKFVFNSYQHDTGNKSFLGTSGNYDGDDAVRLVIEQKACGQFIAKKLIRFFVADDIEISDQLAEPLANCLRESDFDVTEALNKIFTSRLFYSPAAVGRKIKSPIELVVGVMRYLQVSSNMDQAATRWQELGQLPLYPPNVKGWDGGRKWINASTILGRANLVADIVSNGNAKFADGSLANWWKKNTSGDPIVSISNDLLAVELQVDVIERLQALIPNKKQLSNSDVGKALSAIAALPEFQLN